MMPAMPAASAASSPRLPVLLALSGLLALLLLGLLLLAAGERAQAARERDQGRLIERALWLRGELHALAAAETSWLLQGHGEDLLRAQRHGQEMRAAIETLLALTAEDPAQLAHVRQLQGQVDEALGRADAALREARLSGPSQGLPQARISALLARVDSVVSALHSGAQQQLGDGVAASATRRLCAWLLAALAIPVLLLQLAVLFFESRGRARAEAEQGRLATRAEQADRRAERHALDLQRLAELGDQLRLAKSIEEIGEVLGGAMRNVLPQLHGALYLQAPSRNVVRRQVSWGKAEPPLEDLFTADDCWAMRRGVAYPSEAHAPPCRHLAAGTDPAHVVCVPLVAQGETLGTLHFSGQMTPSLQERRVAQTIADLLALAVSQLRLQETMRVQSVRDPLSSLFNRRYMDASLLRECLRARRAQQTLALLLIDLDDFKTFNEKHSHEAGDAALAQLGALIGQTVRPEDIAGRHGGEEFLILMPEADLATARDRAELLRRAIRALPIDLHGRRVEPITCSIGVALYPLHGSEPGLCLRAADKAMRLAKSSGRDRVEIADAAPPAGKTATAG
jgi:diguanylate cyclase (GGDEF)-like protein